MLCTPRMTAAWVKRAMLWKKHQRPWTVRWMKNMWSIMQYNIHSYKIKESCLYVNQTSSEKCYAKWNGSVVKGKMLHDYELTK